jgi:hypothetical protein
MHTAVEVFMRARDAQKRIDPMLAVVNQMTNRMMRHVLDTKLPLIKYGRRKRRYRRMFPSNVAAMRITLDEHAGLQSRPITHRDFYL